MLMVVFLWILAAWPKPTQAYVPTPTPFMVSPQVVSIGAVIGLSEAQLAEVHAQVGGDCHDEAAFACYDDNVETIYIMPKALANHRVYTTLAHEYYHFVFARKLNASGRKVTGDSLVALYNRNDQLGSELRWRLEPYTKDGLVPGTDEFDTELHSIWCTEVADNRMTANSLQYCAKWVPGRNALENSIY